MGLTSLQVCMDMDSASDRQHHHHWLQATMDVDACLMDSSAVSPSERDHILGPSSQILMSERRLRPPQDQALKCPRCDSTHTKFCYYNNYSLSQPRYFCKTCRRYWTKGGTLRNIPVGGGFRKNRKSSSSSSSSSSSKKLSSNDQLQSQPLSVLSSSINSSLQHVHHHNPNNPNLMMMMSLPNPVDIQLSSFQTDNSNNNNNGYQFSLPSNMMPASGSYSESMHYNNIASSLECSPASGLIRPIEFCNMDHKQVEAIVMNTSSKSNNNNHGYFSSQFVPEGGFSGNSHLRSSSSIYGNVQNLGYAHDLGLSYIDINNNNNNNSAAHDQLGYSGLHEHHHVINPMDHEVKHNMKTMPALEWQQEGFSDPRSSKESFEHLRSWSGISSSAGNYHHHHQQQQQQRQLLPSATTNITH